MQRKFIYDGGLSRRYHTVDVLKEQNIAEHSFGVAWLCELLTQGTARKELIMSALAHDLAEHMVGDIPSPAKRAMDIGAKFHEYETKHLKTAGLDYESELYEGEKFTLKLADMMDGMMYCIREARLGNRGVGIVYKRFGAYAQEIMRQYENVEAAAAWTFNKETAEQFINDMHNEWRCLNEQYSKQQTS